MPQRSARAIVDEYPRLKIPMLERLQRLLESQTVGMKRSDLTVVDIPVRERAFDRSESHERASKLVESLDIRGTGSGALGFELFQIHDCPNALARTGGSGVFVVGSGCFTFAAALNSKPGCIASVTRFAAVSAVKDLMGTLGFLP
jgi:hypothetical protein